MAKPTREQKIQMAADLSKLGRKYPGRWICRDSTTGRGIRLHQTTSTAYGPLFDTPAEALRYFMENDK